MLQATLVRVCRRYQSLFRVGHAEEAHLVDLHERGAMEHFHREYFRHELEKGEAALHRFAPFADRWADWKVLDFGCGGGGLTCQLATRFREAWGIDIDADKLAFAEAQVEQRGQSNVRLVCYDGAELPFPDASFDCIFCVDVLEHLPNPERFVRQFERVLRPGGQLLLSFGPPWRHAHGKHQWARLPGWWTHLLFPRPVVMTVRGFAPETTWESLGLHRLTVGAFEAVMRRSGFETVHLHRSAHRAVTWLKQVPLLREFFIAEVVGVFRKT